MAKAEEPPAQACRTCKHYDLAAVLAKNGREVRGRVARCRFPLERVAMPAAMGYRGELPPFPTSSMEPSDGGDCKTWEAREVMP